MSRIDTEARTLLLERRETLARGGPRRSDPSLRERAGRELAEVEAALRRIEEGVYGTCLACGGPMGLQRIRAIPEARYCLSCSGQHELVD